MPRSLLLAPLLLANLASRTAAQQPAPPAEASDTQTLTLHVSSQLVLLDASVEMKKTGERIPGLSPADFVLTEDGKPQTITSFSEDQLPLSLVFLFDLTDTVHPVLVHLADGANAVLHHLRPDDEVAVMTFSSTTKLVQGFTRDRMTAVEGIDSAAASYDEREPTFIFEDLWQAVAQSRHARLPNSRRVEIWLTDGSANDQDTQRGLAQHAPPALHTEAQATDALLRSGVVVSELIEKSSIPVQRADRFGDIEQAAEATGGPVLYATAADIGERFASLLDTLRERYTLGYRPSTPRPEGALCHLKLTLSPAFFAAHPEIRAKDVRIRSRQSYIRQNTTPR